MSTHRAAKNILIVGAGIAGLALARQLQKMNIPFTLVEKRSVLGADGTGIALPANAVRALRYLGLGDEIDRQAHRVKEIIYTKPSGKVLSKASLLVPPLNIDNFVAMTRGQCHELMRAGLEEMIHLNTTVESLTLQKENVLVKFNGLNLPESEYSAVIGADGLHSQIKRLAFGNYPLVDLNVTNWRWICDYPTDYLQPTYMIGAQDIIMAYPIARDLVYCYAHIYDPKKQYTKRDDHRSNLKKIFGNYRGIATEMLTYLPDNPEILPGRLCSVSKVLFCQGHIGLIGDASSACSPMLQQGAASALEDAIVLSELLAEFSSERALILYKKYRHDRVNWIVQASDGPMKKIIKMNSSLALFMRNLLIEYKGPLNVQGWRKLLMEDPIDQLPKFIAAHRH
jgi:2-polyprenyl-6-methoxyphenol hydroxylase-like FAD-dependent oxidoreductase